MNRSTDRKAWIDIARAVGIFAIVYGHLVQGESVISQFFGSFRVAIFFSVMGLTFRYKDGFVSFVKKRATRILIPYFFFAFISIIIFSMASWFFPTIVAGQETGILPNIIGALYANVRAGNMKWNIPLWFLPCSFITSVIIYSAEGIITKLSDNNRLLHRIVLLGFFLCVTLLSYYYSFKPKCPFGLEVAVFMCFFMEFGIVLNSLCSHISARICGLIGFCLFLMGFYFSTRNGSVSVVSLNFGEDIFMYYFVALVTIMGIVFLSIWFCSLNGMRNIKNALCYCGIHTLAILCMHKFPILVFQYIIPYTKDLLRMPASSFTKNAVGFGISFVVIVLCLVVELPINRVCPSLIGNNTKIDF